MVETDEIIFMIRQCELCLDKIIGLFGVKHIPIKDLTMDKSEQRQLNNESLRNLRSNKFLNQWDKFKDSVLEFSYFPFVLNSKKELIAGRHRFKYLKDNPKFNQDTLIPCIRLTGKVLVLPGFNGVVCLPLPVEDASAEGAGFNEKEICGHGINIMKIDNEKDLLESFYLVCRRMNFYLYKYIEKTGGMWKDTLVSYKNSKNQRNNQDEQII